jgi:hypothetical protein
MDKAKSAEYKKLIQRYQTLPDGKRKDRLRNRIYIELRPFMMKWISAILSKKGVFLAKEEILSRSWDCFEYCLKLFKPHKNFYVPNHFYAYTRFYLKAKPIIDKIDTELVPEYVKSNFRASLYREGHKENSSNDSAVIDYDKLYENLEELRSFRAVLDEEYVLVFDDAVMSLAPSNKDRQHRMKESSLTHVRYKESKKLFKIVIDYLLRR